MVRNAKLVAVDGADAQTHDKLIGAESTLCLSCAGIMCSNLQFGDKHAGFRALGFHEKDGNTLMFKSTNGTEFLFDLL